MFLEVLDLLLLKPKEGKYFEICNYFKLKRTKIKCFHEAKIKFYLIPKMRTCLQ